MFYKFIVENRRTEILIVKADSEEEARKKLEDFDIHEEENCSEDYIFDEAILDSVNEED